MMLTLMVKPMLPTRACGTHINAGTAPSVVTTLSTINDVIASSGTDDVVPTAHDDDVVPTLTDHDVSTPRSDQDVRPIGPDDGGSFAVTQRATPLLGCSGNRIDHRQQQGCRGDQQ
jgi:hypothetical protein